MKNIVILGGGESGTGAAILAKKKNYNVLLSDVGTIAPIYQEKLKEAHIPFEMGKHSVDRILKADLIVKSPGIADTTNLIKTLKVRNIPIWSEIQWAYNHTKAKIIAITGSNGKTTTTSLVYKILKDAGLSVGLAGNIGKSFAYQVATEDFEYYVLEISSFQLDDIKNFKPDVSVLLNITPDHLDRYDHQMEAYAKSKMRITEHQTKADVFIYNADDTIITEQIKKTPTKASCLGFGFDIKPDPGAYIENDALWLNPNKEEFMELKKLALQGRHNQGNAMAAALAANSIGIKKANIRQSLMHFEALSHRLEPVIKVNGIQFINDSKATNINASYYALESIKKPIIWIVGGKDKGNDYSPLVDLAKQKVKAVVCLGLDNTKIIDAFYEMVPIITEAKNMHEAVHKAYGFGKKGDVVLLSPANASFDLFKNYEDRGDQFKKAVKTL